MLGKYRKRRYNLVMLDFTKKIILESKWQKRYKILRAFLYGGTIGFLLILAYQIIFPSITLNYSFSTKASSNKNTISDPRDSNNAELKKGVLPDKKNFLFDTTILGNFSDATIDIILGKNSNQISNGTLSVKKSYRAFLYPLGAPIGFKDGNLFFSDGNFYLISNGEKRQFSSQKVMQELGFSIGMFTPVEKNDLIYNKTGTNIEDASAYPDGTLFLIDGEYYQLKNNQLSLFVSEKAFLSRYDANLALKKDSSFLEKFTLADDQIGLADGTLASSGTSIFVLSKGKSYPIYSPQVFEMMGFNWNDVYQANSEEVGIYKKQKLSMQGFTHPDGTIFEDAQTKNYYIIENGQKHQIIGTELIKSYLKIHPILVDSASLNNTATCTLKKDLITLQNSYSCTIPLKNIMTEKGNDYQFTGNFDSGIHIGQINAIFNTAPNVINMRNSLSYIKASVINNHNTIQ
jgi:hypothetical protein